MILALLITFAQVAIAHPIAHPCNELVFPQSIDTRRISLRQVRAADVPMLMEIMKNPLIADKHEKDLTHETPDYADFEERLMRPTRSPEWTARFYTVWMHKNAIGLVQVAVQHVQHKDASTLFHEGERWISIGSSLHPSYWNQGLGSELIAIVIEVAKKQFSPTGFCDLVQKNNPAGRKVLEKNGYVPVGYVPVQGNPDAELFVRMPAAELAVRIKELRARQADWTNMKK